MPKKHLGFQPAVDQKVKKTDRLDLFSLALKLRTFQFVQVRTFLSYENITAAGYLHGLQLTFSPILYIYKKFFQTFPAS
ncbi:MAG: hypothetical protein MRERC_3c064 [Mycoplasmataceae bacterium RC_NB112A]|nr:MAG: hypothetical protein MRERC_3c064 [Mycoplasmataceae bacterium RC_NB112A]